LNNLTDLEHKIITKQWMIFILISLRKNKMLSYKQISQISQIATSTLSPKLKELVKYKFIEKYEYGSVSKPHRTEYQITNLGINVLNDVLPPKVT